MSKTKKVGLATLLTVYFLVGILEREYRYTDQKFSSTLSLMNKAQVGDFITLGGEYYFVKERPDSFVIIAEKTPQSEQKIRRVRLAIPRFARQDGLEEKDRILARRHDKWWEANIAFHFTH